MKSKTSTCVQCTIRLRQLNRLARASPSLSVSIARPVSPPLSHRHPPASASCRLYATAPNCGLGRVVPTRNAFAKVRFTRADVPPPEFWDAAVRPSLAPDVSADECFRAAQAYADAALKDAPGWRERLVAVDDGSPLGGKGAKTLSAYTLHYVAALLVLNHLGNASHLATHILHTLTCMDYAPSILTMLRIAVRVQDVRQPQFEPAFEGLERILRRMDKGSGGKSASKGNGGDFAADACTLRGLIHAAEDTREGDTNALRWFRRAYEMGTAAASRSPADQATDPGKTPGNGAAAAAAAVEDAGEDPREDARGEESSHYGPDHYWQWKLSFALSVASIRMKRGEVDKARAMYEMASSELDSPAGYLGVARVLEETGARDTDAYVEALERAAVSGNKAAARRMGEREWDRAAEAGLGRWEKRKRQVVAEEWMAVAGASAAPAEG